MFERREGWTENVIVESNININIPWVETLHLDEIDE